MLLLSVDSSAVTASAALFKDGEIIKSKFINKGLTHSETLLPLIAEVMEGYDYKSLNTIAVTSGPGSFTGVRIGIATVKGIAFPYDIPCIGISTLESIAYNFVKENAVICSVMDARRMQFYNALFSVKNGVVTRLCSDRAISAENLKKDIEQFDSVIVAGDGAELFYNTAKAENTALADAERRFQNGIGTAMAALGKTPVKADELVPVYLRPSQAERELKRKKTSP